MQRETLNRLKDFLDYDGMNATRKENIVMTQTYPETMTVTRRGSRATLRSYRRAARDSGPDHFHTRMTPNTTSRQRQIFTALQSSAIGVILILTLSAGPAAAREMHNSPDGNQMRESPERNQSTEKSKGSYASVNGLKMYYEIHGAGRPLVLLHGAFMTIDGFGPLLPALAQTRQVIAVELEGHGRTADLDRPLSLAQMADDVAGLLEQIGVKQADVFGFSLGGMTAMGLAFRHPALVRKLVIVSAPYNKEGFYPATVAMWPTMTVQALAGSPGEQAYARTAPNPKHWPVFFDKMKHFMMSFEGWPAADVQSIKAPTLILLGDTDLIRPESATELFRLLGGCKADGGLSGALPASQLAILPATTHFTILYRTDLLLPIVTPFLDSPMSEPQEGGKHDK